ncbi:alanine racemase [Staphylococcus pseudintermedius]|uniref:alanine racemase n=1 Tax=Staphylococcus pseudintermedius TaxID=283734 RepID=UPI00286E455E|nr:alanine racemase [Staphylococcus pseudintermedius]WMZ61503.1 alanine racemase [Staphylococcus pseudintermedius]WMZ65720.1 alanine racemase [Staphylococcus pseudintermedius]HCA7523493.1 alanine racemase [Staphylococcus pseudintermedius]
MSEKYYRTTTMKVNLDAITENYYALTKLQPNKTMMPVVKANAYGLGSIQIAQHLSQLGAEFFCVATLDEAIELRMHGIKEKILILSSIPPDAINKAIQHRVAVTVPSRAWLEAATAEIDEDNEKTLWLHIKVDTGMNRLGVKDIEAYHDIINFVHAHENLVFEGAFSHFHSADEDNDSAHLQYERFEEIIESTEHPTYIHMQNSAGTLRFNPSLCNAFRPGIALYGYYPSAFIEKIATAQLAPAVQLVTEVMEVKSLIKGETVGYGQTYTAPEDMTIALLPIGYADGYLRSMQGANVRIGTTECEIVGRVSMDRTAIRVPATVQMGEEVILIDDQAHTSQSVESLAAQQQTINYEVLCNIGRRVPRVYFVQEMVEISNELLK